MTSDVVVVDFETEAIASRPAFPPRPVGVSIALPGKQPRYYGWGHPTGNNCTVAEGRAALGAVWNRPLLFHNAKFDMAVAVDGMGLPDLPWSQVHDTLFLLFLADPHSPSLSLKPSAHRLLGMAPTESDAVRDWLIEARIVKRNASKDWGAHISKAPGDLVGLYANGDVLRTRELFNYLNPKVISAGMGEAYDRERRLLTHILRYEARGLRVDRNGLTRELAGMESAILDVENALREYAGLGDLESFDKREELADRLIRHGHVAELPRTAKGRVSTTRTALVGALKDPELARLLAYRGAAHTCLSTFLRPWEEQSRSSGRLFPEWNQVRGDEYGTRSGRLSSSNPNFQNIPKVFQLPVPPGFPELPVLRGLVLPEEECVWVSADFQAQEIRMLAHFAEGALEKMYIENPDLDAHARAAELISARINRPIDRKATKVIAFSLLYGAGLVTTASRLGTDQLTAHQIKHAYLDVLPGVRQFQREVTAAAEAGGVTSWGGRVLTAPHGRNYALVNYLIQGSSADYTKQAILDYEEEPGPSAFLCTVHDEINVSAPEDRVSESVEAVRSVMEKDRLSVPMRADITVGPTWGSQKSWKK